MFVYTTDLYNVDWASPFMRDRMFTFQDPEQRAVQWHYIDKLLNNTVPNHIFYLQPITKRSIYLQSN